MSIATEIERIQNAKASIKTAIESKGVTVPSTAKIDNYSNYIDDIATSSSLSVSVGGWGNNTIGYKDFTIPANSTEAIITIVSTWEGNTDNYSCTKQSGAPVTISVANSKTTHSQGHNTTYYMGIQTYRITKAKGSSSVVRITLTNAYGHTGASVSCVCN